MRKDEDMGGTYNVWRVEINPFNSEIFVFLSQLFLEMIELMKPLIMGQMPPGHKFSACGLQTHSINSVF